MADDKAHRRAIDAVAARNADCRNLRVSDVNDKFLEGSLYTVSFELDFADETQTYSNRVYITKRDISVYASDSVLLDRIGQIKKENQNFTWSGHDLVSGLIAIVLILTICYLALSSKDIPQVLGNALSVILGFYFAKSINRSNSRAGG